MAMTTGAADAGVLNLNVGNRPRAGNAGDGDDFANALDTQMQNPRTEPRRADPRGKHESRSQPPVAKEKTDEPSKPREGRTGDDKRVEGKEGAEEATRKKVADPDRSLVAVLLQARLSDPEAKEEAGVEREGSTGESGKDLPSPATDAALLAVTQAPGESATATPVAATTASARTIDPRLMAAMAPGEPVDEVPVMEAADGVMADGSLIGRAADGGREGPTEPQMVTRSDTLAQNAAPKGEKADNFAATLSALREAAPRASHDTPVTVTTPAAPAANAAQGATTHAATPTLPPVRVPVGQHGWDQVVSERVLWMTRHNLQEAKIELNPRDLGPIEVRVSVQDDQASVAFTTHSPAARDALEAAMPRLRDMLADNGLNLAQSDVSHRSPQQQAESGWGNGGQQGSGHLLDAGSEEQPGTTVETPLPSLGAVDYYA